MTQKSPSRHRRTTLLGCIFATKAYIDNRKKIVNQQYLPTCLRNMVNFGPLITEIGSGVWSTHANFNGFRVLAALLHGTLVVGVSHTLRRWTRGRHLYPAGRPSHWALTHILVYAIFNFYGRLRSRCGHYIFVLWFLPSSFFFSSPNLCHRRLDVYHTSTHGVALVRI